MMNVKTPMTAPVGRQSGFSIMEVLIAMLVLAIGLLGLAALQAQGLRFNQDAYIRSQATQIAYDVLDRMRANRANLAAYTAPDPSPGGVPSCDPTDAAVAAELNCWYESLAAAIPAGDAVITPNGLANYFDITVRWADRTPRDFAGTRRLPNSSAECTAIPSRAWVPAAPVGARCKVTQVWTVRP
jgi:type IV pilus assembly protein PilV